MTGSVDPTDGEKKLSIVDLGIRGRGFDWQFRRIYRGHNYRKILGKKPDFGENWTFSYGDEYLLKDGTGAENSSNYANFRAGQSGGIYVNIATGKWAAPRENYTQLRINSAGDFEIREEDGDIRVYHNFQTTTTPNKNGRLKELRDRNGNRMTFHYEQLDPDSQVSGDEKFVLAFVIDTLGREIRYTYFARTAQAPGGRQLAVATTSTASFGRLNYVEDFKGNMDFTGSTQPDFPGQDTNRRVMFEYDSEGNLVQVRSPIVLGTPNGNNFTSGKATRYKYIVEGDLATLVSNWTSLTIDQKNTGRTFLLHKMTHIWRPNEVRGNLGTNPPDTEAAEVLTYNTTAAFDPSSSAVLVRGSFLGFISSYRVGDIDASGAPIEPKHPNGVPSGGTVTYTYTDLNPTRLVPPGLTTNEEPLYNTQNLKVQIVDRNGNTAEYIYGAGKNLIEYKELPRGLRSGEPTNGFILTLEHAKDRVLKKGTAPELDQYTPTYNKTSSDRFQQGNLTRSIKTPGPRGGDQAKIERVYVYEPIYNRPCLYVFARGTDVKNNDPEDSANQFIPPIPDPAESVRLMTDPYDSSKKLNLRYAKVEFFDFQESPIASTGWSATSSWTPTTVDSVTVKATEVLLVRVLGLPEGPSDTERADSIRTLRSRLSANLTKLGLGDLNGDGITDPIVAGNIIRTVFGSPVLLPGTNQASLEATIDGIDLINQSLAYDQGGTLESDQGTKLQTIVWMYQYNKFGQVIQTISPEANVTTHEYFPENDPDGDSNITPTPPAADGRTLGTQDSASDRVNGGGGYVHFTVVDRTRTDSYVKFFDQSGTNKATATFHNNNTAPAATDIKTCACIYDDVGNLTQRHDPRGIRTDYFVNELDQIVQVTRAADISEASSANPTDPLVGIGSLFGQLKDFKYLSRTSFDYNGNVVLSQVEERGNTSSVEGSGLGTLPTHATNTTPGLSSADGTGLEAWVDTLSLYDRLDDLIETRAEVDATRSLLTKYRYDGNQHRVLVIYPQGNADSWVYDERELLFQMTRGAQVKPTAGKYASTDPADNTLNRPGGTGTVPSTFTYNYDKNRNLTETVDAADHGGAKSSIAPTGSGAGDMTARTYDGYDRLKTVTDPLGNKSTSVYDPDSNVVRVIADGDPVDDVAGSSQNKTLSVTETIYDELSRAYVVHQVLFKTPDATPSRTPTLTDTSAMDSLAAYLSDSSSDTALPLGTTGLATSDILGRVTSITEYDRESRATFVIQDDLDAHRTDYDGASRAIKTTDSALSNGFSSGAFTPGNISGNLVETAYDDNSNAIEVKETDVTTVANVASEVFRTTSLYDSLDRLQIQVTSTFATIQSVEHAQAMDLRYDSRGNLVTQADSVGPVTSRNMSRRGLGSTASIRVNDFGNVSRSRFDGLSRLLERESILTASGQGDGSKIGATIEGGQAKTGGDVDYSDCPTRDPNQSGDGVISLYNAWNNNSQILAFRDDNGNTTYYVFDNQNRTICQVLGLALTGTSFAAVTCPDSGTTGETGAFGVALRGGVTPVNTEATGTENTFAYDKDSNLVQSKNEGDINRVRSTFDCAYDALNRWKGCVITVGTNSLFIGTRSPDVQTPAQRWEYDGLSRKTFCLDINEPNPTSDDVECKFFYDSLSRKVEETQKIGSPGAKALSCSYDIAASGAVWQPSTCTFPATEDRKVHSRYDALDRLVRRFDDDGTTQYSDIGKYEYIGKGRVAVLSYQNEIRLTHVGQVSSQNADVGFDGLRRIVDHRWEKFDPSASPPTPLGAGTRVLEYEHRDSTLLPMYDRANNKRIEHKTHDTANSEQYKYDSVYRLASTGTGSQGVDARGFERGTFTNGTRTSMSGGVAFFQDWDLEGLGNWSRFENNSTTAETRTHSDYNEIVDRTVSSTTATMLHDKNGNVTDTGTFSSSIPGTGLKLEWDALNRLRKVQKWNGSTHVLVSEYTYDCENRRLRKVVTNSGSLNGTTDFYYEGWRVFEERDGADAVTNQYVWGDYLDEVWTLDNRRSGATIANLNNGTGTLRHFYHQNTLYHVYGLTDEDANLREAYEYDAYGRQTVITDGNDGDVIVNFTTNDARTPGGASTINTSPWMYTGQRMEAESQLVYFKGRYLHAESGRFLSRDPLAFELHEWNLYQYVISRPTSLIDPEGHAPVIVAKLRGPDLLDDGQVSFELEYRFIAIGQPAGVVVLQRIVASELGIRKVRGLPDGGYVGAFGFVEWFRIAAGGVAGPDTHFIKLGPNWCSFLFQAKISSGTGTVVGGQAGNFGFVQNPEPETFQLGGFIPPPYMNPAFPPQGVGAFLPGGETQWSLRYKFTDLGCYTWKACGRGPAMRLSGTYETFELDGPVAGRGPGRWSGFKP